VSFCYAKEAIGMDAGFTSERGTRLPGLLYGTAWKKERTAGLVEQALRLGFRGIDTACQPKHYDEAGVGAGLQAALRQGIERGQIYVQTKFTPLGGQDPRRVPYDARAPLAEQVFESCQVSLANLRVSVLDGLLLHSPIAPFEQLLVAWRAFEELVDAGLVRELGISNCYDLALLERLWGAARVRPLVVQNRFYDKTGFDLEIRAFCRRAGLIYQSFWTLTANPGLLGHAHTGALAARHQVTREQVLFRALTQLGILPLTGTCSEQHQREDLAIFDFSLSQRELDDMSALLGSSG
jgi:diketogulonate reductase-like aldo/keto reductase